MSITAERLREVLDYNPESGEFRWLLATNSMVRVGMIAGSINRGGYSLICIDGGRYLAHRLAFLFMTGKFPELDVDHTDGDTANNSWTNLREATVSENHANSRRRCDNTSGHKGVSFRKASQNWCAQIQVNGRKMYLGLFESAEAAHAAYLAAAQRYFGEFARAA